MSEEIDKKIVSDAGVEELVDMVAALDGSGREIILQSLDKELTETKKKELIARITKTVLVTDTKIKEWITNRLPLVYISGMNQSGEVIAKIQGKKMPEPLTLELLRGSAEMSPHIDAVNRIMSDAYLDFGNAMSGYVRGAEHKLNNTMKQQIQRKLAVGRLDGAGAKEIAETIVRDLGDQGFTVLLDKRGTQWSLERYSDMLARTHVIRANNEGTINRCLDYQIDIVEVSAHKTQCKICGPYEGKKFSITGKSRNYPKLEVQWPIHPNCRHSLLPRPDLN